MAGKRHHYLPQFLLSGFCHRVTGNDFYCWIYRQGQQSYETNIRNAGVEGYFYGKPEISNLDEDITRVETGFAELTKKLRQMKVVAPHLKLEVSRLVVHLASRTKYVRSSFSSGIDSLMSNMAEIAANPQKTQELLLNTIRKSPELIDRLIQEELDRRCLNEKLTLESKQQLNDLAHIYAPSLIQRSLLRRNSFSQIIEDRKKSLPNVIKSGHIRALEKSISSEERIKQLSHLSWEVLAFSNHSIVLGDVGIWAIRLENDEPVAFTWAGKQIEIVTLPLSHSHVLIGRSPDAKTMFTAEQINHISVSLSIEYFVSSENTPSREHLTTAIGRSAMDEIKNGIDSAMQKLHK